MAQFSGYRCSVCGIEYAPEKVTYLCPVDGGVLDVQMDWGKIAKKLKPADLRASSEYSMWRYLPLLPVDDPGHAGTPFRAAGWTPVYKPALLAKALTLPNLWIKDESSNPTASFKDRASALVLARGEQIGAGVVVTASTGNAGAALAGMAAAIGASAVILAPKTAPAAKVAQLLIYGARVILVDGNYDAAVELSRQAAEEFGWYCRNTGYNPFSAEGKKTAAFEIWEQVLVDLKSDTPLSIFIPVGDGNIIAGIHKGFKDLLALGWLKQMPRLFGVQAEGSAAIANAFVAQSESINAVSANTIADSISVDLPSDGLRALRAATQTSGAYVKVSDAEILQAVAELGQSGIFAEPAGAAAFAGLRVARKSGLIEDSNPVLVLNTGSGLKDVNSARKAVGEAPVIEPSLQALKLALEVMH
jgi:threonine synthase